MVNQLDTSALDPGGFKTIRDQVAKNALTDQEIQKGNIANQAAAHAHAVQVLSEAVASGDQGIYDHAKNGLAEMGINTSNLAPDIQTGAQQVTAARNALYNSNPLNALLGMGLKAEGNLNSATSALGSTGAAAAADPLSASIANKVQGVQVPGTAPTMGSPSGRHITGAQQVEADGRVKQFPVTVAQLDGVQQPQGVPMPAPNAAPASAPPAAMPSALPASGLPPVATAAPADQGGALDANGSTPTKFVPPQPIPGETAAVTQNRIQNAFAQWKENPAVQKVSKTAETSGAHEGEEIGDAAKAMNVMSSNLPAVLGRFEKMRAYSPDASSGLGVDAEGGGIYPKIANSMLGSEKTAKANAQMKQLTAQGIFPEINAAFGQSGTKGNKFLETIINNASGIQMDAPSNSKIQQIDNNEAMFVANMKATAKHLRDVGQPAPSDQEIDAQVAQAKQAATTQGGMPATPANKPDLRAVSKARFDLQKKGFSEEKINAYLQAKGLQ